MRVLRPHVLIAIAVLLSAVPAGADGHDVVDAVATFRVVNTNTSELVCPSDAGAYTVRGHLIGPADALDDPAGGAVTLYLHGAGLSEATWTFDAVPGLHHAAEMAELGHVSVTIERVGWDAPYPHGWLACVGSAADVAHQVVASLRAGSYAVEGRSPVAFARVVAAGHDIGGAIAQVEAYSFSDVDGLVVMGYHNQGVGDEGLREFLDAEAVCALGGYTWLGTPESFRSHSVADAEPGVADAMVALREKVPCGELASTATEVLTGADRLGDITVPVLLVYAADDFGFTADGAAEQPAHFSGSDDVSYVMLAEAAHFFMLERRAPEFRAVLSDWLSSRWTAGGV